MCFLQLIDWLMKRYVMSKRQFLWDLSIHRLYFYSVKEEVSRRMSPSEEIPKRSRNFPRIRLGKCKLSLDPTPHCMLSFRFAYLWGQWGSASLSRVFPKYMTKYSLVKRSGCSEIEHVLAAHCYFRAVPALLNCTTTTGTIWNYK